MKIILNKDVPKVGQKHDVVDVAAGYAYNYLFPKGLARFASDEEVEEVKMKKEAEAAQKEAQDKKVLEVLKKIDGKRLSVKVKANDKGVLFAELHEEGIQKALESEFDTTIPKEAIIITEPIKEIGERELTLRYGEGKAVLTLTIEEK